MAVQLSADMSCVHSKTLERSEPDRIAATGSSLQLRAAQQHCASEDFFLYTIKKNSHYTIAIATKYLLSFHVIYL